MLIIPLVMCKKCRFVSHLLYIHVHHVQEKWESEQYLVRLCKIGRIIRVYLPASWNPVFVNQARERTNSLTVNQEEPRIKKSGARPLFPAFAVELAVCCSLFNHSLSDDACYFEVDFLVFQVGQDVGVLTALAGNDVGQFQLVQLEHDV